MTTKLCVNDVKERCDIIISKAKNSTGTEMIGGIAFSIVNYITISRLCCDITTEESNSLIKEFTQKIYSEIPSEIPPSFKKMESKAWVPTRETHHSYDMLVSMGRKEEADKLYPERAMSQDLGRV